MRQIIIYFSILYFSISFCFGQKQRFNAGFVLGLNFSELEGKDITDYYGLNTGLIANARLAKHTQISAELLFSQNGEYILPECYPAYEYGKIRLNHIEIPFHIDWLIGVFEREKFYDWHINLGFAYTRLLSYKVEDIGKNDVSNQIDYLNKEALLFQIGSSYYFNSRFGFSFKASLPLRVDGLSWTLAARMVYMINPYSR